MNITIKNFLFIQESFLNLVNDMYFVLGQNEISTGSESNGSGKSLFLEAIYYCFVGKSLRGTPLPSLVGPFGQSMSVKIEGVTRSNSKFSITRYRSASKSGLDIVFNDEVKSFQKTEFAQDFIFENILNLTRSQAEIVLYTGEYSPHLLDVTPSIRTSILLGLINYDEDTHKKIAEYCKAKIAEYTTSISVKENELNIVPLKYEKIEANLRNALTKHQTSVELHRNNFEAANKDRMERRKAYNQFLEESDYENKLNRLREESQKILNDRQDAINIKNSTTAILNENNKRMSGVGSLISASVDKLLRLTIDNINSASDFINSDDFKFPATSRFEESIKKSKRISVINANSMSMNSELEDLRAKKASIKTNRELKQKLTDKTLKEITTLNEEKKNDTWTCSSCKTVFAKENFAEAIEHIERSIEEKNEILRNIGFDIKSMDYETEEINNRMQLLTKTLAEEKSESMDLFTELSEMCDKIAEEQSKKFVEYFDRDKIESIANKIKEESWNTAGSSIDTNQAIQKVVDCLFESIPDASEIRSKIISKIRNNKIITVDADTSETISYTIQHRLSKCDRSDLESFIQKSTELTSKEISDHIISLRKDIAKIDEDIKSKKVKIEETNQRIKSLEETHSKLKVEYDFAVEVAATHKGKLGEAIENLEVENAKFEQSVASITTQREEEIKSIKKATRKLSEMRAASELIKNQELPSYKRNVIVTFLKKFEVNVNNYLNSIQSDIYCFIDLVDDEVTILFSDISKNKQMLPFSMFSRGERTRIKKVFTQIIVEIFNPVFVLSDESFDGLDNYGMKEIIKFSIATNTGRPYLEASPVDVNTIVEDPCRTILALKRAHELHGAVIDVLDRS